MNQWIHEGYDPGVTDSPPGDEHRSSWFKSDLQRGAVITGVLGFIGVVVAAIIAANAQSKPAAQIGSTGVSSTPSTSANSPAASSPPSIKVPGKRLPDDQFKYGVCVDLWKNEGEKFWNTNYQPCVAEHNAQIVAILNQAGPNSDTEGEDAVRICNAIVSDMTKGRPDVYTTFTLTPADPSTSSTYGCFAWTPSARTKGSLFEWSV